MEKERGIAIIGVNEAGRTCAIELAKRHEFCDLQFQEPKKEETFKITRLPELPKLWIDPNEHVINYRKHNQTCLKNRKKRKSKKRK